MRNGNYPLLGIVLSHGVTMAITLYLAVRAGNWLDERFNKSPLFLAISVILMAAANLHLMVKDLMAESEKQDRNRKDHKDNGDPVGGKG